MINLLIPDPSVSLRSLFEPSVRPVPSADATNNQASRFSPGERIVATVIRTLDNGHYLAESDGHAFTLALPSAAQPPKAGDRIPLEILNRSLPQVPAGHTAELPLPVSHPLARQTANAQSPVDQAVHTVTARIVAATLPGAGAATFATVRPQMNAADLSQVGRLIGAILDRPRESAAPSQAAPLLGAPPVSAQQLVPVLKAAIEQSGLFYESHMRATFDGRREFSRLEQEPQARLTPAQSAGAEATASYRVAPLHEATAPIVQQQLETLANRQVQWQGQAWPGMEMQWEIAEHSRKNEGLNPDAAPADDAALPRTWSARVASVFPALGDIDARLTLAGDQVRIRVICPRETLNALQTAARQLAEALDAANLTMITFHADAPADAS